LPVLQNQVDVPAAAGGKRAQFRDFFRMCFLLSSMMAWTASSAGRRSDILEPVQRVVDEEVAYGPAVVPVEIDGSAPGCVVPLGEELREYVPR